MLLDDVQHADPLSLLAIRTLVPALARQPVTWILARHPAPTTPALDRLSTTLQQHGATVRTVQSVAEALEALEAWRPDALVTDSCSPNQDTYALVGKVGWLEADRGGRIPAAALTAYGRTDERVRQMLDAVQCDLPKPLEPSVLTAEIARLTGRERRSIERAH